MRSGAQVRILRAAGRAAAVWKNGGGVTREIAVFPEGAGMDDFVWRASLAEVAADGPFSAFPGIDRTITLAEGAGMDLTVGVYAASWTSGSRRRTSPGTSRPAAGSSRVPS